MIFIEKNINISICISSKLDINKKLTGNINFQNLRDYIINYVHKLCTYVHNFKVEKLAIFFKKMKI